METDWLLRSRANADAARTFLEDLADGVYRRVPLTDSLFRRAIEIDRRHAALGLGLVDAAVMAVAEAERAAILTFDFSDFRAAPRTDGPPWPLVIDEAAYARAIKRA